MEPACRERLTEQIRKGALWNGRGARPVVFGQHCSRSPATSRKRLPDPCQEARQILGMHEKMVEEVDVGPGQPRFQSIRFDELHSAGTSPRGLSEQIWIAVDARHAGIRQRGDLAENEPGSAARFHDPPRRAKREHGVHPCAKTGRPCRLSLQEGREARCLQGFDSMSGQLTVSPAASRGQPPPHRSNSLQLLHAASTQSRSRSERISPQS